MIRLLGAVATASLPFIGGAHAAIIPITDGTISGPGYRLNPSAAFQDEIGGVVTLDSIVVDGVTYSDLEFATGATATTFAYYFYATGINDSGGAPTGSNPGSAAASLIGSRVDDGAVDLTAGQVQFGRSIGADDRIFVTELNSGNGFTATLIDANGNPLAGFASLVIPDAAYGDAANDFANILSTTRVNPNGTTQAGPTNVKVGGVSFGLSDFVGTGTPSGATGIAISSTSFDPYNFGLYTVPEPASLALLGLGGAVAFGRRRTV